MGLLVIAAIIASPVQGNLKEGTLGDFEKFLYFGSGLLGFLSIATGIVAVIYLISGVIERFGYLFGRRPKIPEEEQTHSRDA